MSLLAKYLADISTNQTTIGTNYGIYERFNFGGITGSQASPAIGLNLTNLLPTPKANVPLEKIIDFKKERKDNLVHFRKILMDFQGKLAKAKSNAEIKDLSISFKDNITVGIKDLSFAMKSAKIEAFLKSLRSLINIKSLGKAVGVAADEKYQMTSIPLSYKIAGLIVAGGIEVSIQYVELRNKLEGKHRESPFAYLYQAQKSKILKEN